MGDQHRTNKWGHLSLHALFVIADWYTIILNHTNLFTETDYFFKRSSSMYCWSQTTILQSGWFWRGLILAVRVDCAKSVLKVLSSCYHRRWTLSYRIRKLRDYTKVTQIWQVYMYTVYLKTQWSYGSSYVCYSIRHACVTIWITSSRRDMRQYSVVNRQICRTLSCPVSDYSVTDFSPVYAYIFCVFKVF